MALPEEAAAPPRIRPDVVALIRRMANENCLWSAERICGELLKLDIRVANRAIQRYLSKVRSTPPGGQRWSSFFARRRWHLGLRLRTMRQRSSHCFKGHTSTTPCATAQGVRDTISMASARLAASMMAKPAIGNEETMKGPFVVST